MPTCTKLNLELGRKACLRQLPLCSNCNKHETSSMSDVCKACKPDMQKQGVTACIYHMHPSLQAMLAIGFSFV